MNAAAVAASRGVSQVELADRLQKAKQRLVELYRQHDPDEIIVEIKAGTILRMLTELIPEVEAHIRKALQGSQGRSVTAQAARCLLCNIKGVEQYEECRCR